VNLFVQWKTRELIVTAVLGVALGVLMIAWSILYLGPFTSILGEQGAVLLTGIYYLPGILVPYIVRKPGAALLASLVGAITEVLGAAWGLTAIGYGLLQGLGAEVAFGARGWKDYRLPVLGVASLLSAVFGFPLEYIEYSYHQLAPATQVLLFLLRMPSALVLAAWLGKALGDALAKTGVLRGLAIVRKV
jgi:energy-coupling factor transport system substrate-specific component